MISFEKILLHQKIAQAHNGKNTKHFKFNPKLTALHGK